MKKPAFAQIMFASLLAILTLSCSDTHQEELFFEAEEINELPWITIEPVEVTKTTISVKATIQSLGSFRDASNLQYGFIYFETIPEIVLDSASIITSSFEPVQNYIHLGTLTEGVSFTFDTTISELQRGTSYNVCTFLEYDDESMIGEEIAVETLQ